MVQVMDIKKKQKNKTHVSLSKERMNICVFIIRLSYDTHTKTKDASNLREEILLLTG